MNRSALFYLIPVCLLALEGCSDATTDLPTSASAETAVGSSATDNVEAVAPTGEFSPLGGAEAIPVALPKMAYVFDYGFRLAADAIAPLQQKQADLCEAKGPYTCQIVSLTRSGTEDAVTGELQLAVKADKARGIATELSRAAEDAGAKSFKADIQGEDLSKSIVDTDARVRSRIALRDRLMDVLETHRGTVAQLVEAERGVAQVNEEIDQAQSWLKEMRGRVAYSRLTLTYETANPGGSFLNPIRTALGSVGSIAGMVIAALIMMLALAAPLLLGALGIRRWRRHFTREESAQA